MILERQYWEHHLTYSYLEISLDVFLLWCLAEISSLKKWKIEINSIHQHHPYWYNFWAHNVLSTNNVKREVYSMQVIIISVSQIIKKKNKGVDNF